MRAAILSIGDEITLGEALDTNSQWLAARLAERAIEVIEHRTVGDDQAAIAAAIVENSHRAELIILTGGLGPTADDLTRGALNDAISPHEAMEQDESAIEHLKSIFERRGRVMPATNLVQALRPANARMIPNPRGTAMGLAAKVGGVGECDIYALPGPPREMMPMFENHVAPELPMVDDDNAYSTQFVHAFGIGESDAAQRLGELLDRDRLPQIGITVSDAQLTVRVRARGPRDAITRKVEADAAAVEQALFPYVFARGGDTLAKSLGKLLAERKVFVTTAESCTGGLLGKLLVDEPGSSSYYCGGWVTYSNEMKTKCINVPASLIEAHGAVSAEVARAMADGALAEAGCDYALSITGVAGPDGGTAKKPVGTVFIAAASRDRGDGATRQDVRRFQFAGDRAMIRDRSAQSALQMLRFELLSLDAPAPLLWEFREGTATRRAAAACREGAPRHG